MNKLRELWDWLHGVFFDDYGLRNWVWGVGVLGFILMLGVCFAAAAHHDRVEFAEKWAHRPAGIEVMIAPDGQWGGLVRFRDADAGVICYGDSAGLSCVKQ